MLHTSVVFMFIYCKDTLYTESEITFLEFL